MSSPSRAHAAPVGARHLPSALALLGGLVAALLAWRIAVAPHAAVRPAAVAPIADAGEETRCIAMAASDPAGAMAEADAWEATGGGELAVHCRGLALIAEGRVTDGAAMLDGLAGATGAAGPDRAVVYGQAAQAWGLAGQTGRALAAAAAAIRLAPDDPDLLIGHAVAAASGGDFQAAIDDLDHAIDLDPRRADALVYRAAAWRHLGQPALARDDVDRALMQDADNAEALLERGILRELAGDAAGARADWVRVQALAPDTPTARFAAGNLARLPP